MDIKELQAKRRELEHTILKSVAGMLKDFTTETGVCPNYIRINFMEVTNYGDTREVYII